MNSVDYSLSSTHIRPEHFGDDDAPIRLLVLLQNRHDGPADRETRTVQRMHKLCFFAAFGLVTDVSASRLEVFEIRTRRNFSILVLSRQPHFDIIGFCGGKTQIPRAEYDYPICETEALK